MTEAVNKNSIETVSGHFINLLEPDSNDIFIEDIGWALSRMPRYAGHTLTPLAYSVAQHSVVVLELINRLRDPQEIELVASFNDFISIVNDMSFNPKDITGDILLEALLHDASEAYLLDIPTPLKHLPGMADAYCSIEARMMTAIRKRFVISEPDQLTTALVKWADMYALTIEAYHLMKSRGKNWTRLLPVSLPALQDFVMPKPTMEVYEDFISWFEELQYERSQAFLPA